MKVDPDMVNMEAILWSVFIEVEAPAYETATLPYANHLLSQCGDLLRKHVRTNGHYINPVQPGWSRADDAKRLVFADVLDTPGLDALITNFRPFASERRHLRYTQCECHERLPGTILRFSGAVRTSELWPDNLRLVVTCSAQAWTKEDPTDPKEIQCAQMSLGHQARLKWG